MKNKENPHAIRAQLLLKPTTEMLTDELQRFRLQPADNIFMCNKVVKVG